MGAYTYRVSQSCTEWAIGKKWTFARFTRRVWERFAKYGGGMIASPLKVALDAMEQATEVDAARMRKTLADDAAEAVKAKAENREAVLLAGRLKSLSSYLADKALEKATSYLAAESPELQDLLNSHEGGAYLFWLLLEPTHPGVNEDDAYDVYMDLFLNGGADGRKSIKQILSICNGSAPECAKNEEAPAA